MAGTTYDKTSPTGQLEVYGTIKPGFNVIQINIDFSKTPVNASGDNWKILAIKDHWELFNGYTRLTTASTSAATVDIGTAEDGVELDTAVDLSVAAADWQAMDTLVKATSIRIGADGFIWLDFNDAAVSDGTLDIQLQIIVPPDSDN